MKYAEFIHPDHAEIQRAMSQYLTESFVDTPGLDSASVFIRGGAESHPVAYAVASTIAEQGDGFAETHVVGKGIDLLPPTRLQETFSRGYGKLALSAMNPNHLTWGIGLGRAEQDAVLQVALRNDERIERSPDALHTRFFHSDDELTRLSNELVAVIDTADIGQELWLEPPTSPNACLIAFDLERSTESVAHNAYATVRYIEELTETFHRVIAQHGGRKSQKGGDGFTYLLELPGDIRHDADKISLFETETIEPILYTLRSEHQRIGSRYAGVVTNTDIHLASMLGSVRSIGYNDTGKVFWDLHNKLKNSQD